MIHELSSTDDRFKGLKFGPGLNILLADVTEASSEHDSRNSTGKSSLIRLLHFLLGGDAPKEGKFVRHPSLLASSFRLDVDVGSELMSIVRSGNDPNKHLVGTNVGPSADHMRVDEPIPDGWEQLSRDRWRQRLATAWFDLDPNLPRFSPSLRSLLSYLIRVEDSGAFASPFRHYYQQGLGNQQANLSYLLGLDWSIATAFEEVRQEEKSAKALKAAARDGSLGEAVGTSAELRSELAIARERVRTLRARVSGFTVIDEYDVLQEEANQVTRSLRALRDGDAIDRELVADVQEALETEVTPASDDLDRMWAQVGVVLPEHVQMTYEQVTSFHDSIIQNRRIHLEQESALAERRISERRAQQAALDSRRAEIMDVLNSGGALEQFALLESEYARAEADVRDLERRFELTERVENAQANADRQRQDLLVQLRGDHHDRSEALDRAIVLFESYSRELYGEGRGHLVIDATDNGPTFDVEVSGKGSVGIDSMQILCFDFVVATLLAERNLGPGFLVHDSHIFDGVDERQVQAALDLGHRLASESGFQYLVTMNSDHLPEETGNFAPREFVIEVNLTDKGDTGGLFGLRFG